MSRRKNVEYRDPDPAKRKCLMCTKLFNSRCKNERICPKCKGTDIYRSGNPNIGLAETNTRTRRKTSD